MLRGTGLIAAVPKGPITALVCSPPKDMVSILLVYAA